MDHKLLSLPQIEEQVLEFWSKEDIFAKAVALRKDGEPFVFYDGPPFTTGLPHYGHIMQMAFKDAVLRYKTMQGYCVPRKIGWDTHGLPVEYVLEKELNLTGGKKAIVEYGVQNFVDAARGIVLQCTSDWKSTMERMGRWVDVSHPYTTMDNNYIESVWWAFSELYKKELVYKDYRVSPYCSRCGTVVSNFEVNLGYKDNVYDPSVYVAVPAILNGEELHLVLWTTTPWTLPANVALAVSGEAEYSIVRQDEKLYVVASDRVGDVFADAAVVRTVKGSELVGLTYEPPYKIADHTENPPYQVVLGHHVTTDSGTGIVHIAPAYGEDDFKIGREHGFDLLQTVEPDGTVSTGLGIPGEGLFVKKADELIMKDLLEEKKILIKKERIKHTYPFCWRCDTPLLYFPATSWYVNVAKLKDQLIAENNKINWLPDHLQQGRFGKWLEGSRDWAVSRDRFWGAPLPIWECADCDAVKVVGSRAEINADEALDLHRPKIDDVTLPCACGGVMRRVPFVFDCWFESGSMPFAQHHYPFENTGSFNPQEGTGYPADFIAEALDQTRGWFYTLHVLGVALFGQHAYKNVVVSGLMLAGDGKKLSKSLRNYTDPEEVFDAIGVDAMRLFLYTAATIGEDFRYSDAAVNDVKRRWITPLLNSVQYYHLSLPQRVEGKSASDEHAVLDEWMKARVALAREQVTEYMDGKGTHSPFDLARACRVFGPLVEDLSTWYIRLSRGRTDQAFTDTLQSVLINMSTTFAPFLPFLTEHIYQAIKLPDPAFPQSVHLCTLRALEEWKNETVLHEMEVARRVVSLGRDARVKEGIPVRQPLSQLSVLLHEGAQVSFSQPVKSLIGQELQVDAIEVEKTPDPSSSGGNISVKLDATLTDSLKNRGMANLLRRTIQDLRKQANLQAGDAAIVYISNIDDVVAGLLRDQLGQTELSEAEYSGAVIGRAQVAEGDKSLDITLYSR